VPLRGWVKRLEHAAKGDLAGFELLDGARYYFDPTSRELFLHWYECIKAGSAHNWPEPPEVLHKLTEAKDVERAVELVRAEGVWDFLVYDTEVLISERKLVPRSLVSRYDPAAGEHRLLDPYDYEPEDLSEQGGSRWPA
jgi:hypothetical protein